MLKKTYKLMILTALIAGVSVSALGMNSIKPWSFVNETNEEEKVWEKELDTIKKILEQKKTYANRNGFFSRIPTGDKISETTLTDKNTLEYWNEIKNIKNRRNPKKTFVKRFKKKYGDWDW